MEETKTEVRFERLYIDNGGKISNDKGELVKAIPIGDTTVMITRMKKLSELWIFAHKPDQQFFQPEVNAYNLGGPVSGEMYIYSIAYYHILPN
jgi:hypothetical protein